MKINLPIFKTFKLLNAYLHLIKLFKTFFLNSLYKFDFIKANYFYLKNT